jgi:shikimate kinase
VLLGNVRSRLTALVAERAPLYAEVARLTIDTDGVSPEAVADAVLSGLGLEAHDG